MSKHGSPDSTSKLETILMAIVFYGLLIGLVVWGPFGDLALFGPVGFLATLLLAGIVGSVIERFRR